jgi:hypothetical protein
VNTALVFWVCCVGYPAFTLLQSFALIWLLWRFRDEISLEVSDVLAWRPRSWRMRRLPKWSPLSSVDLLDHPWTLLADEAYQGNTMAMELTDARVHLPLSLVEEDPPSNACAAGMSPMAAEVHV